MFLTSTYRKLTLLLVTVISAPLPLAAAELTLDNPRIRELIPGQNKTAAYFDITNEGPDEVSLIGVVSASVGVIEMHTILRDNGMLRMQQVTEVVLPPGKTVRFRSGGVHLMLFEVTDLQKETEIQLLTSDGEVHRAVFHTFSLLE